MKFATDWQDTDSIPKAESTQPGAENAEFPPIDWTAPSANSATSYYHQRAILPPDSILEDWFNFARQRTEGADCYVAGVILTVVGASLARRVWMSLGGTRLFANIFALICGKPGDRKSTTIRLAAALARLCLPANAFIPASFSPESLFDEYDEERGGRPDKVWIVDDANSVLTDWQKTQNGERNATRFLELYDCGPLTESFRRNKKESADGEARRCIPETSTSIIFGATFNVGCFQGQTVRAGMARRFLYYVAERRGRDLFDTPGYDPDVLEFLATDFRRCSEISGEMSFTPEARSNWLAYQKRNRNEMDAAGLLDDDLCGRLSSAPAQVLSVAMIFEAAMWAKRGGTWRDLLSHEALEYAIDHVAECLEAAKWLDSIAHRASIAEDAEVVFERIMRDFADQQRGQTIYAARSDLTRAYCHDSGRRGALKPHDLYNRLIPALIRQGKASLAVKDGKRETYAFRANYETNPEISKTPKDGTDKKTLMSNSVSIVSERAGVSGASATCEEVNPKDEFDNLDEMLDEI